MKVQNRRFFLKRIGMMAAISQVTLSGWTAGFKTLLGEGLDPSGEFSLLKMGKLLSGYRFPFVDQFSTASFTTRYDLYNLYGEEAVFAGKFTLQSGLNRKKRQFDFSVWRLANNGIKKKDKEFKYIVSGQVKCSNNPFFSPEKWDVLSRISLTDKGPAFGSTALVNTGEAKDGEIRMDTLRKQITKSFGSMPLSWKWGLPAVAQNMAENSLQELEFAVLDEFDALHQRQTLKYIKKTGIDCGDGRLVEFRVFELTGSGTIPTVYWVDNLNRTVFIISGMEAFVLEGRHSPAIIR